MMAQPYIIGSGGKTEIKSLNFSVSSPCVCVCVCVWSWGVDSLASLLWSLPLKDTETILLISQPDGVQWELETGTVRQGMAPNQEVPSLCWWERVIHSLTLSPEFPELYCLISTSGCKASGSSYQGDDTSQENVSPVSGSKEQMPSRIWWSQPMLSPYTF